MSAVLLSACTTPPTSEPTDEPTDEPTEIERTPYDPVQLEKDLHHYVIVVDPASDVLLSAAERLARRVADKYDVSLAVMTDPAASVPDGKRAIRIGILGQGQTPDGTPIDETLLRTDEEGNLYLLGSSAEQAQQALEQLMVRYLDFEPSNDLHRLVDGREYEAYATELFTFASKDRRHNITQGAYYDGNEFYIAAVSRAADGTELTRILVLDSQGDTLAESDPLPLDHANNITYNHRLGYLVVSHCQSNDGHYYRYSMVDPFTFEIVETADLPYPFFSMAYCEEKDMYASGEWGGGTLDVWDGALNNVLRRDVQEPGSLSQGVFCDAEGIYFVRSSQNGYGAEIRIYDWELELIRTIPLHLPTSIEPENINLANGKVYVTANTPQGGTAYELTFREVSAPAP